MDNNSVKLLVTGASGFIGYHMHEQLEGEAFVNLDLREPAFQAHSIYEKGDIRDAASVNGILDKYPNVDTIISLAAEHKDFGIPESAYFKTNEHGTRVMCEAAAARGIKRFIFYSSVAIYGNNQDPSTETTPPNPINPYGASKLAGEAVLNEWLAEDPTREILVMRPVVVYGEQNVANMYRLIDQIRKGRYFHVGKGDNVKSIAYGKNLVAATLYLRTKLAPGMEVYNYADEPQLSSRKIADTISKELGKKSASTLPKGLLKVAAIPFDLAIKLTGKDLPISSNRIEKLATQTYHTASKLMATGFKPKYSNTDGLIAMTKWMEAHQNPKEALFDV